MSTYPPPPGNQPGEPYWQPPPEAYGQYGQYGQQQYDAYGQPVPQQYDAYGQPVPQPAQPYGGYGYGYGDGYAQPQYGSYEQPPPPPPEAHAPQPEWPERPEQPEQRPRLRPNPYEELGRLDSEPDPEPHPPRPTRPEPEPESHDVPEPPRRRRRALRGCLAVVAVLLLGAVGTAAYVLGAVWKVGAYKLVPPTSFQNLTSDPGNALAQQMSAAAKSGAGLDVTTASTAYSAHAGDKVPKIMLAGVYGDVFVTGKIDDLWQAVAKGGSGNSGSVTQKTVEPGGPLGGTMQCAVVNTGAASAPACAWADHSTIALVIFLGDLKAPGSPPVDLTVPARQTLALRTAGEVKK